MKALLVVLPLLLGGLPQAVWAGSERDRAVAPETVLSAIANLLSLTPQSIKDYTDVSGEYCFNTGLVEGGHETHYAIDPAKTHEDVIDFVNAEPLIRAGMNVNGLPRLPRKLGSTTPDQWYFLPAGEFEPHHGKKFPVPLLIRATDVFLPDLRFRVWGSKISK